MPLARGPDGRLGVRSGGGGRPMSVTVNVSTPDAESFRRSEAQVSAASPARWRAANAACNASAFAGYHCGDLIFQQQAAALELFESRRRGSGSRTVSSRVEYPGRDRDIFRSSRARNGLVRSALRLSMRLSLRRKVFLQTAPIRGP